MKRRSPFTSALRVGVAAWFVCGVLACGPRGEAPEIARGTEPAERTPLAVVDGETLYREDVVGAAAFRIYRHEVDIYSLLLAETEQRIDALLLAREAKRRGTTVEALLAAVEGEAPAVDEAAVDRYLAEHADEARSAAEHDVRGRVRHYLGERARIERRLALVEGLRDAAGVRILLEPPTQPRTDVDIEGAPARGPQDAPLVVVHFATFSSRASARSAARIAAVAAENPGAIRWVHRNFLNDRDERGLLAARLGAVAQQAGRFWALHDALFAAGGALDASAILAVAREAGLSDAQIDEARRGDDSLRRVKRDLEAANASGAIREPTLFVNGRYVTGLGADDDLQRVVAEELAAPAVE